MKKFTAVLVAILMVTMLATTAFAASVSASYSNGVLSYTVNGLAEGERAEVYLDGDYIDTVSFDNPSGRQHIDLTGSHKVTSSKGGSDTVTGAPVPVESTPVPEETTPAPVESTPAPVESTPAPVESTPAPVESTPAPVESTPAPEKTTPAPEKTTPAPAQTTPAPTKTASADADDDVPKTGDTATVAYLIGAAMVLAAAYLLLRRRVHSK